MNEFDTIIIQTRCKVALIHDDHPSFSIDENEEKAKWVDICFMSACVLP